MDNVFEKALENVKSQPAYYTIMALVLFAGLVGPLSLPEDKKLTGFVACLITVVALLFLVRNSERGGNDKTSGDLAGQTDLPGHALSDDLRVLDKACQTLCEGKPSDHPILAMLGGYISEFSVELNKGFLEVAPIYYQACFSKLNKQGTAEVYAIADLDADGESWNIPQSTLWEGVKERLFHLNWKDLYSDQLETLITKSLKEDKAIIQSNHCRIKLVTSRESLRHHWVHPLERHGAIGKNLLIIGNQLLGGYVKSSSGIQLRLEAASQLSVTEAKKQYERVANDAIEISPDMTPQEIRSKWIRNFDIGLWDPGWNGKQERGPRYVEDYDQNIYCWIPDYDHVIEQCFSVAKIELDRRCQSPEKKIRVLELGCGTGALTEKVAEWALGLSHVLDKRIDEYHIIDQSRKMLDAAEARLNRRLNRRQIDFITFEQMQFNPASMNESGEKYDVVIGSLLFHFLVGVDWNDEKISSVLDHIRKEWLAEDGCVILADVFFSESNRQEEMTHWKEHMKHMGMSEDSIRLFYTNNRDMTEAPSFEALKTVTKDHAFNAKLYSTPIGHNPFNILKLD